MTPGDRAILKELAMCEPGKGLLSTGGPRKRAAKRLVAKGWADVIENSGMFVAIITAEGRAAIAQDAGERRDG